MRAIPSEVELGPDEGLPQPCAGCDSIVTIAKSTLDPRPVGRLDAFKRAKLDLALRFALDILY